MGEYEKDKLYQAQLALQVEAAGEKMLFSMSGEYDIPTANYTIDAYAEMRHGDWKHPHRRYYGGSGSRRVLQRGG